MQMARRHPGVQGGAAKLGSAQGARCRSLLTRGQAVPLSGDTTPCVTLSTTTLPSSSTHLLRTLCWCALRTGLVATREEAGQQRHLSPLAVVQRDACQRVAPDRQGAAALRYLFLPPWSVGVEQLLDRPGAQVAGVSLRGTEERVQQVQDLVVGLLHGLLNRFPSPRVHTCLSGQALLAVTLAQLVKAPIGTDHG